MSPTRLDSSTKDIHSVYYEVDAVISGIRGSEHCVFVAYVCKCARAGQVNPYFKNEGDLECLALHVIKVKKLV